MANESRGAALISGGINGIGLAITRALARDGYPVVAFGLDRRQIGSSAEGGVGNTAAELARNGHPGLSLDADVSAVSDVQAVVACALEKFGGIEVLVTNAAIHPFGGVAETSPEVWERVLAVNLTGAFHCVRAVAPHMIEHGRGAIITIGSGSGWGRPNLLAYSASKGGLNAMTSALAQEMQPHGVRVNQVVPAGPIPTGMTDVRVSASGPTDVDAAAQARRDAPDSDVSADDVADAVAFLASDRARHITGTSINVGGAEVRSLAKPIWSRRD